jgi:hypothetical protein
MLKNECQAGTNAQQSINADVTTASQTIAKPHVVCSLSPFVIKPLRLNLWKLKIMTPQKFKIEVSDWTKINIESAKFILEEAKTYVKYLSDTSDKITNRAFAILAILIPITSALIVFSVNERFKPLIGDKVISYLMLFVIIGLIATMFGLSSIIFPRMFMPLGREPKQICTPEFLSVNFDIELAKLSMVLNEIENCQAKVDYNKSQNSNRTKQLKHAMLSLGLIFVIATSTLIGYLF